MSTKKQRRGGRNMLFGGGLGVLLLTLCRPGEVNQATRTTVVFPARIVSVVDGSTIRIAAPLEVDVHLEGIEITGPGAAAAVAELERSIDKGAAVLFSAGGSNGTAYVGSLFTARRVAANIRLDGEAETLSERLIRLGHAVPILPPGRKDNSR